MKKRMLVMLAAALLLVPVCAMGEGQTPAYVQITQDEAKRMMEEMESVVILDVREQDEYDAAISRALCCCLSARLMRNRQHPCLRIRISLRSCTAAADGAARSPRRRSQRLAIRRCTNSAA